MGVGNRVSVTKRSTRTYRFLAAAFCGLVFVLAPSVALAASAPNPSLTPGASDPRVTQTNVSTTICRSGYTSTVRNVSTQTKHAIYVAYGIPNSAQRNYVIDHLIPLEVGGANTVTNLWPEPKADAKVKDKLENSMHAAVCAGKISLSDAQAKFIVVAPAAAAAPPVTAPPTTAPLPPPPTDTPAPAATDAPAPQAPAGATAICVDGTYSYSQTRSGTCSHHGGVAQWL
jgi:hypothetical protein